ncbi:hypothetical protein [Basilea psittacipulmonis]|uniref:hypothetical protein n=1 Tax=Basilea psittacipulmonis TaxID=1472345 RepID=UPI00068B74C8|nr:hypothetical protein [Basilea psittacipulmonis]
MKKTALLLATALLAGCGTVGNSVITDQVLQNKVAFALNTSSDLIKISNRVGDINDIQFQAVANGQTYQCYVTTLAGLVTSDAVCSGPLKTAKKASARSSKSTTPRTDNSSTPTTSPSKPANSTPECNALLKAANRC